MTRPQRNPTQWIWLDMSPSAAPNQYVDFRGSFSCAKMPAACLLRVSVDSEFVAWINGACVAGGQFGDYPDDRTYTEIDVAAYVTPGKNTLAVQVHYCGVEHASYIPGEPGLWYEVEADGERVAASGCETLCRPSPCYTADGTSRITPQRGFTFHYDACAAGATQADAADPDAGAGWQPAVATGHDQTPRPRPLPALNRRKQIPGVVIAQGLLKRDGGDTHGMLMQRDYLSARRPWELFTDVERGDAPIAGEVTLDAASLGAADGAYVVYDLGQQECGYVSLQVASSARCVVDVAVGEHLDDLRVRAHIDGRNFASRYVARPGEQDFTHWHHRFAGRFIQLHITELSGTLQLRGVGLVEAAYPVREVGRYEESDALSNAIWLTSRRTLHLCMHEHYEDSPWREQALYANDARNQMLSGFYTFDDYDFARESLDLLLRGAQDDGYLNLCAPMSTGLTIPSFTMAWLLALTDYYMYSGDELYVRKVLPRVVELLRTFEASVQDGLLPCPRGERYWHFYDWAPGLNGTIDDDCARIAQGAGLRFDAPLNALWLMALRAIASAAGFLGEDELAAHCLSEAEAGASSFHARFYDAASRLYRTYDGASAAEHYGELTQALAVLAGVGDDRVREQLRQGLLRDDERLVATTLSQSVYKYEAILTEPALGSDAKKGLVGCWAPMLYAGATSFWETHRGSWDFHHAGSLCHGWSAIPPYFYGAYGLGVKPLKPGFEEVAISPLLGVERAEGIVPTPRGPIAISLRQEGGRPVVESSVPAGIAVVGGRDTDLTTSRQRSPSA